MTKSVIDKMKESKHNYEIVQVSFFNDKKVRTDDRWYAKTMAGTDSKYEYGKIEELLCDAARSYAFFNNDYDTMVMDLEVGLIFNKEDVSDDNVINPDAKPIKDIVRYYVKSISSYSNGEKTNRGDYAEYGMGRQSYIKYNQLVALTRKSGLSFNGPESFEEFEECILQGEPFDISISASLKDEKDSTNHNQNVRVK